jgi:hypothetical protein
MNLTPHRLQPVSLIGLKRTTSRGGLLIVHRLDSYFRSIGSGRMWEAAMWRAFSNTLPATGRTGNDWLPSFRAPACCQ